MTTRIVVDPTVSTEQAAVSRADTRDTGQPSTLVWIDAREARFARWVDGQVRTGHMESDVPPHHRGTGHVRHDASSGHGGGGPQAATGEGHRRELLARFIVSVAERIPTGDALLILGPGRVRQRLEQLVRASDEEHGFIRGVDSRAASRMSEARLGERLRQFAGVEARRRTTGAYRWGDTSVHRASGKVVPGPNRVARKPPTLLDEEEGD